MKATEAPELIYEVIRSRRATADIIVERDGRVLVRAPQWVDDEQIKRIIAAKRVWIHKTLAEWRDLNAARVLREFKNGEGFLYLGRAYRLRLVDEQAEPLQLKDGRFMMRRDLIEHDGLGAATAAFKAYYMARGRVRLRQRVAYYAPKVGVDQPAIDVRELGHRWASCSPNGKVAFHWKCMMAPQTIIDYIVVHELCHFHYRDHNDTFWNEVDKVIPNYRERKAWLRQNGAGLAL